jgi:hypothetical protein
MSVVNGTRQYTQLCIHTFLWTAALIIHLCKIMIPIVIQKEYNFFHPWSHTPGTRVPTLNTIQKSRPRKQKNDMLHSLGVKIFVTFFFCLPKH